MKILTVFVAALSAFIGGTYGENLKCNGCQFSTDTLKVLECSDTYSCEPDVKSCETIIVKENGNYSVVFGCSVNRCKSSDDEFKSCKDSGVCYDCCDSDNCNVKADLPTIFGIVAEETTTTATLNKQEKINAALEALEKKNEDNTVADNSTSATISSVPQDAVNVTISVIESNQNVTTPEVPESVNITSNSTTTLAPESSTVRQGKPKPPVYPEDEDTLEDLDAFLDGVVTDADKKDKKPEGNFENVDTLEDDSKIKGDDEPKTKLDEKVDFKDDLSKPVDDLEEDIKTSTENPLKDDLFDKSKGDFDNQENEEADDDDLGNLFGLFGDAARPKPNNESDYEGYVMDEAIGNVDLNNIENVTTTSSPPTESTSVEPSSATNHFTVFNSLLMVVLVLLAQTNFN